MALKNFKSPWSYAVAIGSMFLFAACGDDSSSTKVAEPVDDPSSSSIAGETPDGEESSSSVIQSDNEGSSSNIDSLNSSSSISEESSSSKVPEPAEGATSSSSVEQNCSAILKGKSGWSWDVPKECRFNPDITYGTMTDSRDGQTYKIERIGSQKWMAQNLNYETPNSYCYNDSAEYCEEYGRLYTWVSARDACPTGWHLPTREDLDTLLSTVGGDSLAGNVLKSFAGWNRAEDEGNGVDSYGFSGSPAGWMDLTGDYYQVGYFGCFWSISSCSDKKAYTLHLKYNAESGSLDCTLKESAISVRCVKD